MTGRRRRFNDSLLCVVKPDYQRQLEDPLKIHGYASCYQFSYQQLQLAKQRFAFGAPYGLSLDALAIVEVQVHALPSEGEGRARLTTVLSVEPEIINEELRLRIQHRLVYDDGDLTLAIGKYYIGTRAHFNPEYKTRARMSDLHCAFEFGMGVHRLRGGQGKALVVTKWLNFGRGESPRDELWRRHLHASGQKVSGARLSRVSGQEGERGAFEAVHDKPYDLLIDEMAALLEERKAFLRDFLPPGRDYWKEWAV